MDGRGERCRMPMPPRFDAPEFGGPWTQEKLDILRRYLDGYTTALKNQPFNLIYVDGFAGAGSYKESGSDYEDFHEFRQGSARIALEIDDKPFDQLIFVEKGKKRATSLRELALEHHPRTIKVVQGDANTEVTRFCGRMEPLDRAVVFLDPHATEVSWTTIEAIARTKKIDCWILFPFMAVTRIMKKSGEPRTEQANRLDRIFGRREHWQRGYRDSPQLSFLDVEPRRERGPSNQIALLFRDRLEEVFHRVAPNSRTLVNSKNVPLFELFFAASNPVGAGPAMRIANHVLENW